MTLLFAECYQIPFVCKQYPSSTPPNTPIISKMNANKKTATTKVIAVCDVKSPCQSTTHLCQSILHRLFKTLNHFFAFFLGDGDWA